MKKIVVVLIALSFLLGGCRSGKSVIPDNTLYKEQPSTESKATKIIENNPKEVKTLLSSDIAINRMSIYLGVAPEKLANRDLYSFVYSWLDVPYLWGGETRNGIDCSSFVQRLYQKVYHTEIPRTSNQMFWFKDLKRFKKKKYLKEGDLVFFRINKEKTISHVGVYLQNNKFIASGSSNGVHVEDLNDAYWISTYVASGRVIKHSGE